MKAILMTNVIGDTIGGEPKVMSQAKSLLSPTNILPGQIHSIHKIEFDDPMIYAYTENEAPHVRSNCYMITFLTEDDSDIRLFYITSGPWIIPAFSLDRSETVKYLCYQKDKFAKLPDEEKLIEFLLSIEQVVYPPNKLRILLPLGMNLRTLITDIFWGTGKKDEEALNAKIKDLQENVHQIIKIDGESVCNVKIVEKDIYYYLTDNRHEPAICRPIKYAQVILDTEKTK